MGRGASITAPLNREIDLCRPILSGGGGCKVEIDIAHVVRGKCYVLRETSHQSTILRRVPMQIQRKWDPLQRGNGEVISITVVIHANRYLNTFSSLSCPHLLLTWNHPAIHCNVSEFYHDRDGRTDIGDSFYVYDLVTVEQIPTKVLKIVAKDISGVYFLMFN